MIDFETFKKIDLRAAKIISVQRIKGTEKLLKLEVDLGNEKRQIIAGIAQIYKADDLVGREIILVANLEPKTILGLESQGMLLAADDNERPILLIPEKEVPPGTKIR